MTKWQSKLSERGTYRLILLTCILSCIIGVIVGVVTGNSNHAGRGGALGVAISFFSLFALRPYGNELVNTFGERANALLDKLGSEDDEADRLEERLERIERGQQLLSQKLKVDGLGQQRQNIYLAWAGGISTLFWGFGDIIACWLIEGSWE